MIINGYEIKPGANLRKAVLRGVNLCWADLRKVDLREVDLREADLREADLRRVNLCRADLRDSSFIGADLRGAYMHDADLRGAGYSVVQIMMASWGELSDDLTVELMRLDASALPNGEALMNDWTNGGSCPLRMGGKDRVVLFKEKKRLWSPGPAKPLWELWEMIAKECGVRI